jgi:hypothetical protein
MQEIKLPKLRKIDPNKPKKKKILLLSDDLRMHSGIATMSREFVMGTCSNSGRLEDDADSYCGIARHVYGPR